MAVAQRNADCYLARCDASLVPPWDFDVPPGPDRIDDSSAAAIAASGLWNLADLTDKREPARADRFRNAALSILDSLCTDRYLAWSDAGWEGVLKHGVYHFHKKLGVDESVMWGDFFFLEAVAKVLRDHPTKSQTSAEHGEYVGSLWAQLVSSTGRIAIRFFLTRAFLTALDLLH